MLYIVIKYKNIPSMKNVNEVFLSPLFLYSFDVIKIERPKKINVIGIEILKDKALVKPRIAKATVRDEKISFNVFII